MPKVRRLSSQKRYINTLSCRLLLIVVTLGLCFATPVVSTWGAGKSRTANSQAAADNTHTLVAPYYSVKEGLKATLMLSNQGPNQLPVQVRLFNPSGVQFDLPALTLSGREARTLDLGQTAPQDAAFEDGNVWVEFQGKRLELGGVVTLVNAAQSVIFDEELAEPARDFASNRLEGVWWKPAGHTETLLALSNTGNSQLSVTVRTMAQGAHDLDSTSEILTLGAHETRTLTTESRLPGNARHLRATAGGISINHSGAPGELVVAGFIHDPVRGFSNVIDFYDPEKSKTARLDGAGLRFGTVAGVPLSQIVVVRNVSDSPVAVSGRIPYTSTDGGEGVVTLPSFELAPGELKKVSVPGIRGKDEVKSAGLEFISSGAPGSIVASALSLSADRTHVFRVPMRDATVQSSSTGEYPWSLDDSSSSVIYIKNATGSEKQYTMYVNFDGGSYALGVVAIPGGQTHAYDIRALRDGQMPDANGNTISLSASQGHVHWSVRGEDIKALIGRVEQVDVTNGLSMTAACNVCCPDSYDNSYCTPTSVVGVVGDTSQFTTYEQDRDCNGSLLDPFPKSYGSTAWSTDNTSVATINDNGLATATGIGSTNIHSDFSGAVYQLTGEPPNQYCVMSIVAANPSALCAVKPLIRVTKPGTPAAMFSPSTIHTNPTPGPSSSTGTIQITASTTCNTDENCLHPDDQVVVEILKDSTGGFFTYQYFTGGTWYTGQSYTLDLNPGNAVTASFVVTTAQNTPSGQYNFTIRVLDVRRKSGQSILQNVILLPSDGGQQEALTVATP